MNAKATAIACLAAVLLAAAGAMADVTIATVPVGDPGNTGEWSGGNHGGYGPDRICGTVGYEYGIGKYEVTAGQYAVFLNAVGGVDTYGLYNTGMGGTSSGIGSGIARNGGGTTAFVNRPVNYVSWGDAARFANWLNNGQPTGAQDLTTTEDGAYFLNGATSNAQLMSVVRKPGCKWAIPTEDEWYKAAYYKGGGTNAGNWDYPTGSDTAPARDKADVSGNNANFWSSSGSSGPYPIDSGKYTTVVGEFQNSDSPYGTFDQGGNVWEWNETVVQVGSGFFRGWRGGAFDYNISGLGATDREFEWPTNEYSDFGFRIAEVPEPGTMVVFALGGIGMVLRGRGIRRQA